MPTGGLHKVFTLPALRRGAPGSTMRKFGASQTRPTVVAQRGAMRAAGGDHQAPDSVPIRTCGGRDVGASHCVVSTTNELCIDESPRQLRYEP